MAFARYRHLLWWAPVGLAVHDCVGSLQFVRRGRVCSPLEASSDDERSVFLVDKLSPRLYRYRRDSLVALRSSEDPSTLLVRRLVALEGDWVTAPDGRTLRVPPGRCWVESDASHASTRPPPGSELRHGVAPLALVSGRLLWRAS